MTNPTLLQRIFNAPSQSYTFPIQEKNYHSTKATLLKVAAQDDLVASLPASFTFSAPNLSNVLAETASNQDNLS
jgi:hypothetical protein